MKTDLFQSCGHCWVFQTCWHIECSNFLASSFRIWNSSTGIPSPPLALFVVMLPKAHLTSHSRMYSSRWMITLSWLSGSFLYSSSVCSHHLFLIPTASVKVTLSLSRVQLFATPWTVAYQVPSMRFSRQEYWSELPFPSPEDLFPTQGSNSGLLHCRQTPYFLSHQGNQVYTISVLYWAHLCMKCSLGISHFLEEISSVSHSIVFLYFLHWSLRKASLSLLAILWNSAFKWVYLAFSPLLFAFLLFTAICKAASDCHFFLFRISFSWGTSWSLSPVQCHKPSSIVHHAIYQI